MTTLIIHQTHACEEVDLLPLLARLRRTVIKQNPDAVHRYWSDASLATFIATSYPRLITAFRTARVGVQRSDLGRLALLHAFGGLYLDTDVECLRPFLPPLVGGPRLALAPEPQGQVDALYGGGTYLCNAVMYAPAGDPVVAACLAHVEAAWDARGPSMWAASFDVIGGRLLTRMWQERADAVDVLPAAVCYPINDLKLAYLPTHAADVEAARTGRFGDAAQAVHWWLHTNFEGRAALCQVGGAGAWPFLAALYGIK